MAAILSRPQCVKRGRLHQYHVNLVDNLIRRALVIYARSSHFMRINKSDHSAILCEIAAQEKTQRKQSDKEFQMIYAITNSGQLIDKHIITKMYSIVF